MIAKWAQEDVETLDNLLNNNNISVVTDKADIKNKITCAPSTQ